MTYNWMAEENRCSETVYVTWDRARSGGGAATVMPGRKAGTGLSRTEIDSAGGIQFVVCRAGYLPVDASDGSWTYGEPYRCRRR